METFIGALIVAVVAWALGAWWTKRQTITTERRELARELIRSRGSQAEFARAMNEIPVAFDDDPTIMTLYRQFVSGHPSDEAMLSLLVRLGEVTGIAKSAEPEDLRLYLSAVSPEQGLCISVECPDRGARIRSSE